MFGRTGEAREYEDPRIVRRLGCQILHGDEIHAIAQGRDQANLRLRRRKPNRVRLPKLLFR